MRKFITSLTAVATVTLAAVPALGLLQAAHAAEPTARILVGDLNLNDPAQVAVFETRVDTAANGVCSERARANPGGDFTIAGCKSAAHKQAAAQLSKVQRQGLQMAARATPVFVAAR